MAPPLRPRSPLLVGLQVYISKNTKKAPHTIRFMMDGHFITNPIDLSRLGHVLPFTPVVALPASAQVSIVPYELSPRDELAVYGLDASAPGNDGTRVPGRWRVHGRQEASSALSASPLPAPHQPVQHQPRQLQVVSGEKPTKSKRSLRNLKSSRSQLSGDKILWVDADGWGSSYLYTRSGNFSAATGGAHGDESPLPQRVKLTPYNSKAKRAAVRLGPTSTDPLLLREADWIQVARGTGGQTAHEQLLAVYKALIKRGVQPKKAPEGAASSSLPAESEPEFESELESVDLSLHSLMDAMVGSVVLNNMCDVMPDVGSDSSSASSPTAVADVSASATSPHGVSQPTVGYSALSKDLGMRVRVRRSSGERGPGQLVGERENRGGAPLTLGKGAEASSPLLSGVVVDIAGNGWRRVRFDADPSQVLFHSMT